jgi:hypothetical protein
METESSAERARRLGEEAGQERDTIVIQMPAIDPEIRRLLCDFFPGRALLRVLANPPKETVEHARNARRERLLAVRSLVDALIEDTEQPRTRRRAREVEIE